MYLQQNMRINAEPIFAIAKVPMKVLPQIIDIKHALASKCEPIEVSFNSKTCQLNVSGFIFQLVKIKK